VDTTVPKNPQTPDIPEPPLGSVVLDRDGLAWQRTLPVLVDVAIDCWERAGLEAFGQSFEWLTLNAGPLTVVYTPRAGTVYVIEQRINLAAGGHAFQLLPAGFAHPSAANAQAAVEHMAGAMRWNDRLEGRQPGDRLPLFRIVEVPLDQPRGGVR
jgi:hypothetical protein